MYLYYFERIVRAAVIETGGPEDWALPYWNYGRNGRNATMPLPFRPPPVGLAALAMPRNPGINAGATIPPDDHAPDEGAGPAGLHRQRPSSAAATPAPGQFEGETGRLEQTPHNDIHVAIGGFMGNPDTAGLDPIFWLHHCNIDRLWAVWNGQRRLNPDGRRRGPTRPFSFFDADGTEASLTCGEVNDTIDRPRLHLPPQSGTGATGHARAPSYPGGDLDRLEPDEPEPRAGRRVGASRWSSSARPPGSPSRSTQRATAGLLGDTDAGAPRRVYLNVEDIEAEQNPGTVYGIYVNLPEDAPPDVAALHYAGNVSFFGIERARDPRGDEHGHGMRVAMEITDLVRDLRETGDWDDETLDVVFKPIELIPPEVPDDEDAVLMASEGENPPVSIGRVSVFFA